MMFDRCRSRVHSQWLEAHTGSTEWQYHLIRSVKSYERSQPEQHPVGMTFQYRDGTNQNFYDSPADWISSEFTLNLKDAPGTYAAEWFDINKDRSVPAGPVAASADGHSRRLD